MTRTLALAHTHKLTCLAPASTAHPSSHSPTPTYYSELYGRTYMHPSELFYVVLTCAALGHQVETNQSATLLDSNLCKKLAQIRDFSQ